MSSSESSGEFESADDEIVEITTSKLSTPNTKVCSPQSDQSEKCPDKEISQIINDLTLDHGYQLKNTEGCENLQASSNMTPCNSDKTKRKTPRKLGTKLSSYKATDTTLIKSNVIFDRKEDEVSEEDNTISPMKSIIPNSDNLASNINKCSKATLINDLQNTLGNSQSNDGLNLIEENGFVIPSILTTTSSHGIKQQQEQSWGGWGGWGLLTTATESMSTFSSQVAAGLSTVLESTVGSPDSETTEEIPKGEVYGGLGSLVSGVSQVGSSVINRGLDTLESIGKKTMEVLQEGDPGLKKKRALLFATEDKPVLSQILREAKEKAEHIDSEREYKEGARKVHFESLFDDFEGMVHLEALEMLSAMSKLKLQDLLRGESGTSVDDLQETLSQVLDLCELSDEEDEFETISHDQFKEQVTSCIGGLHINLLPVKIIQMDERVVMRLSESETASDVHQSAISTLAEITATAMEYFHKSAEIIMCKEVHNTADEAESYVRLTSLLSARVSAIANEFTQLLTKDNPIANSSLITNIFMEASNSCLYIKNAYQLVIPILQVGAVTS